MRKYAAILRSMSGSTSRLNPGGSFRRSPTRPDSPVGKGDSSAPWPPLGISASRSHVVQVSMAPAFWGRVRQSRL